MTIEADPRHLETLVDSTGVKDERPLTTNGSKDDQEKEAGRDIGQGREAGRQFGIDVQIGCRMLEFLSRGSPRLEDFKNYKMK